MNSAEFADSQGFSRPYVTKLVHQGVIARDPDGHIDKDAGVAALAAPRDPAKALRRGRAPKNGDISGLSTVGGQASEALSTLMLKSRIKKEVERGKLAELDSMRGRGKRSAKLPTGSVCMNAPKPRRARCPTAACS